jgi:rhodanese-related sulfurtransferase
MHLVPTRLGDLNPDEDIVIVCHHGGRSMQVAMFLERKGFSSLINLTGGVSAWADEVAPDFPRY